jgi:hypothetical protein
MAATLTSSHHGEKATEQTGIPSLKSTNSIIRTTLKLLKVLFLNYQSLGLQPMNLRRDIIQSIADT